MVDGSFARNEHIVDALRKAVRSLERGLLVDCRGTRNGFPPKIVQELEALREYHALLYPSSHSPWDHVEEAK